jgi:sacsin
LTWTNLSSCKESIGLLDGITAVPQIEGVQFLLAKDSSSSQQLLQALELNCHNTVGVIQNYIIPGWSKDWTASSKEQMADFILGQFSCLSLVTQNKLQKLPMVPVAKLDGEDTSKFACAGELIDPSVSELTELCFQGEEIVPKKKFWAKFKVALKGCGLKTAVDEAVVQHRIHCYANAKYPLEKVRERAHKLLKSDFSWTSPLNQQEGSELRSLKWLPTAGLDNALSLKTSDECRSRRDRMVVSSQLPVLKISISAKWQERLGWENTLSSQILISQLKYGIGRADRRIVDAVLTYISQKKLTEKLITDLMGLQCVLDTSGSFIWPSQSFRPSKISITRYERLQPYLANVDRNFWQDHQDLLIKIGVRDGLELADLIKIQTVLESKPLLEKSDVDVAIEILSFACRFSRESLAGLKIIDKFGVFHPIHDVNYDDLGLLKPKQKVNLAHPDIPDGLIKALGIDSLRERLIKGMLEIEDVDDEDEFDQRENVTTRIADTLDRYPVETTFREYLANADDAQETSKVSWLLDPRTHDENNLLTPEMSKFQGPALLVHNDGGKPFSDTDVISTMLTEML